MVITNPLELPEIREALAPFLATNDLARCARVCRDWHASFLPFFWRVLDIHAEHGKSPDLDLLKRYNSHVAHLIYRGNVPTDHLSIQFPALRMLHLLTASLQDTEMVGKHSSLTHLKLHRTSGSKINWNLPAGLSNLTSLSLDRIDVRSQDNDMVWNLVSRLESLEIRQSTMPGLPKSLMDGWRMKELVLDSESDLAIKGEMRWMERCRHLKRLTWIPLYVSTGAAIEELTQSIAANTWPELEEFYSPYIKGSDQRLSFVIGRMRRVPALSINCDEPLDLVRTALRPHFAWLTKLEVATTFGDNALFALEVLKSCPKLQSLKMGMVPVQARDMLNDDAPWVCEGSLKHLAVCFNVEDDITKAGQKMLLERLSRLHKLEQLDLSCKPPVQSLDLRLESGLEQLATLTQLEELTFRGTVQKMTVKDASWMIKHWKSLKSVKGRMNSEDAVEWGRVVTMLYESRVACNPWDV